MTLSRFIPTGRALHALALAIIVPPAVATALVGAYLLATYASIMHSSALEQLILYIFLTGLILSLGGCLAFGIPAHLFLRRMRWTGVWTYMALGLVGSFFILAISAASSGQWIPTDGIDAAMVGLTIFGGPLAAWIFWRTARPDQTATITTTP